MMKKYFVFILTLMIGLSFYIGSTAKANEDISHYTCGMHPSVNVSVENFQKGDTKCPICFMPLTPIEKKTATDEGFDEGVISQVIIDLKELKLAGIKTEKIIKRKLYKEIRAVGSVAFDPKMAIAQEEYVSVLKSFNKAKEGKLKEITDRAESLVESSKKKLIFLGLSEEQIKEIEKSQKVQTNLILPEDKM